MRNKSNDPERGSSAELLYNYKDGLLPREKALTEIWGTNDYFTARSMDVYVTKLRKYFKDDQNIKIENVHGSGFRLVIEEVKKAEGKPQLFLLLGYGYFSCLTIGRIFRGVHALESCDPVLIGACLIYPYRVFQYVGTFGQRIEKEIGNGIFRFFIVYGTEFPDCPITARWVRNRQL